MSSRVDWNRGMYILDTMPFSACPHILNMFFLHVISLYVLVLISERMVVNSHTTHKKTDLHAAHKVLLMCSTQSLTHVQHMKYGSCAAHEILLACST